MGEFEEDGIFFKFPDGCCGFTAELLGKYLHNHGIETLYMSGKHKQNGQSHAWLETYNGIVIDITRDQFSKQRGTLKSCDRVYVNYRDKFVNSFYIDGPRRGYDEGFEMPDSLGVETRLQRDFKRRYALITSYL